MVYQLCQQHNYEPLITLTATTPRYFESTFPILYDKSIAGEAERAKGFYNVLVEEGKKLGVYPYRLPVSHMNLLDKDTPQFTLVKTLKKAIDPDNILAPGRYCNQDLSE
jgi:4-cresol dehydrogenase (hydroxylating) flavoprotein subunit